MTSSEAHLARSWLAGIYDKIAPRRLDRMVDVPVDTVTHEYLSQLQPVMSHAELVVVIAAFVQQLQEMALPMRRTIAFHEAFAEGVALLNAAHGNGATGYDLAVLSIQSGGDVEEVVLQIGAVAKAREREGMIKWTIEDAVARCTWDERRRLVAGILEAVGDSLPSDVRSRPTEQWAPFLGDLVHAVYRTVAQIEDARPKGIGVAENPSVSPLSLLLQPPLTHAETDEEERNTFSQAEA